MDAEDGQYFVERIGDASTLVVLLESAIPYYSFLTDEARAFLLPDFLAVVEGDTTNAVSFTTHFEEGRADDVLRILHEDELAAVDEFVGWMKVSPEFEPYREMISPVSADIHSFRTQRSRERPSADAPERLSP